MNRCWILLLVLPLAACSVEHNLSPPEVMTAQNGARGYAENIGGKYLTCSGLDSDGDKYTSCEVTDKSGTIHKIVCSYSAGAAGCKSK